NFLWASDDLTYLDKDDDDYEFFSAYQNGYIWLVWDAALSPTLHARTLPYTGHITTDRSGNTFRTSNRVLHEQVDDTRKTTLYGLKSDWTYQPHKNHLLRFGADIKRQTANYNYYRREQIARSSFNRTYDTTRVITDATATEYNAYLADKWRIAGQLTVDVGLRFDRHTHTSENKLSPRIALAMPVGHNTVLRAAWGRYYQSQSPDDLDVQYNVQTFRPSERATHYILGLEQKLPNSIRLRIEGYYKDLDGIHDRFEDVQNEIELMPELHSDIAQLFPETGSVRGLEFFLKRDSGGRFNWWASYTLSQARETHKNQGRFPQVYGQTYPQKRDQRHQLALDLIYRPSPNWNISTAWQYRTGWPHTAIHAVPTQTGGKSIQYVDLYDQRYPAYHRIDINLNRTFTFQSWKLRTSIGVINLYNRRNVRSYIYDWNGPEQGLTRTKETWFPRLPSFTLSAEF
ncbi:MAG: TonB-dependent receptor, partial [Candidatus Latescibacteria bacterium]|nr:TonB-dependent receptor [Candidatus Latescibacterota bacterium]